MRSPGTDRQAGKHAARGRSRALAVAVIAAAFIGASVSAARAALTDPPDTSDPPRSVVDDISNTAQENPETIPDNDRTPVAESETVDWKQVGGAVFPRAAADDPAAVIEGSPTRYSDNLFDVDFSSGDLGLAGGSECQDSDPDADFRPDSAPSCQPVAFLYTRTPETGEVWERVELGGSGYVGAIAWMTPSVAMLVGGDGTFPRREPPYGKDMAGRPCDPPPTNLHPFSWECDQTGDARAWLYDHNAAAWCELGHDRGCPELPEGRQVAGGDREAVHGLTAVDFRRYADGRLLGFVGGLGQIWRWEGMPGTGGRFDKLYDNRSPADEVAPPNDPTNGPNPRLFRFRVREIEIGPVDYPFAYAITSGCCSRYDTTDHPLILWYSERGASNVPIPGRWSYRQVSGIPNSPRTDPDEPFDRIDALVGERTTPRLPPIDLPAHKSGAESPDSLYAMVTAKHRNILTPPSASLLATQASMDSAAEQPSEIWDCTSSRPWFPHPPTSLATARFLAIDGEVERNPGQDTSPGTCTPDWAVGELRSVSREGHGRRGLVMGIKTPARMVQPANTQPTPEEIATGSWEPTSEGQIRDHLDSHFALAPTYTLNSLEMIGQSGRGWSVGDHGALLRIGGVDQAAGRIREPTPPRLGGRRRGELPERGDYPGPATNGEAGAVPSLAARPKTEASAPQLVNYGTPDAALFPSAIQETEDVAQIVMSRDGTEGWAIGPNPSDAFNASAHVTDSGYGVASFYHYDGEAWTRCDPTGVVGQLPPDPACASVSRLRAFKDERGITKTVKLVSAARVPLENDADPSNDDEFEIVAIGTVYLDPKTQPEQWDPVILRYRNDVWDFEDKNAREAITSAVPYPGPNDPLSPIGQVALKDVAFTAPDDGWILGRHGLGPPGWVNELYRFDGNRWWRCRLNEPINPQTGEGRLYTEDDPHLTDCGTERIPAPETDTGVLQRMMRMIAAGDRVYIYGHRPVQSVLSQSNVPILGSGTAHQTPTAPFILYHERRREGWRAEGGGYDPAFGNPTPGLSGRILSLSVAENVDGTYLGWAVGQFSDTELPGGSGGGVHNIREPAAALMRLEPDGRWRRFRDRGALEDNMWNWGIRGGVTEPHLQATLATATGEPRALVAKNSSGLLFSFNADQERWESVASGRPSMSRAPGEAIAGQELIEGHYQAIAPDNQGGAWIAVKTNSNGEGSPISSNVWSGGGHVFFYHYTDRPPEPVFEEVANPFGDRNVRLTSLAGSNDGSVWAATNSSLIARYDRVTGWQTTQIPGWDPGRLATRSSEINAIAAAPDGAGVAVGKAGRIANLSPASVSLDEAASVVCEGSGLGPGCGTSRDLNAAAVAPDGSAFLGGDSMATLWRPSPDESFQRIADPPGGINSNITGISMPEPETAWITTQTGFVIAGRMSAPGQWSWEIENKVLSGPERGLILGSLTLDANLRLRSVAIDRSGHGYAVGDDGLVLERTGEADQPWRRLRAPGRDDLTVVTVSNDSGGGAVIGGRHGVVWTARGSQVDVARPADFYRHTGNDDDRSVLGPLTGPVVGAALIPGYRAGDVEAWIAIQERGVGTNRLLHYASDPANPLLNPDARAIAIDDAPADRPDELRIAAFGKSDCQRRQFCSPMMGTGDTEEVMLRRIVDEVQGNADLALFTGDATNSTGAAGSSATPFDRAGDPLSLVAATDGGLIGHEPRDSGSRHHVRFSEWVADPLERSGVPFMGALGPLDLSRPRYQSVTTEETKIGENLAWRGGFVDRAAPWGTGGERVAGTGIELSPAAGSDDASQELPEETVDADLDDQQDPVIQPVEVKNGARTHYAVDAIRNGEAAARIVVVDSSLRGLAVADGIQNPIEPDGQLGWIERMLCFRGETSPSGGQCTRDREQEAIVLSNTPTYSYAAIDPTATATDAAALEALYLRYRVAAVISGRLGWNGLYYALQPGLHAPCPGGAYPERPPDPDAALCESVASRAPVPGVPDAGDPEATLEGASGVKVRELLGGLGGDGIVPFVVASGAGGKFGPNGENNASGSAPAGFWHGYTIVRVPADGDPRKLIVEQRPILDTLTVEGQEHVLPAGQRLRLRGVGRGPIAFSRATATSVARYNEISTAAITHRYELLLADPGEPWVPCEAGDAACVTLQTKLGGGTEGEERCAPYLCLPERIGTIDTSNGEVRAGNGKYPDTFAVAMLSVGDHVATYPLVFQKSPSFVVQPLNLAPPLPQAPQAAPSPPQPPNPPSPPQPNVPNPSVPEVPPPPPVPSIAASQPPEPQPPAPPAPPPPTEQLSPLSLTLAPPSPVVATPTAVIQPPTPPVNPAPPGGARREARQRQAAAQKSGADSDGEESAHGDAREYGGDQVQGRASPDQAFRRHDRARPERSFTPLARGDQPSAWAQGALYTGGIALMAFALAAGTSRGRPTPRSRSPELPAPALARTRSRRET